MALPRPVTRGLVTVGALTGLGAAFLAGTTFGDPDAPGAGPARGGSGTDASPAAYVGSDLSPAASCDELLGWYVDQGVDQVGAYGWGDDQLYYFGGITDDGVAMPLAEAASGAVRGSAPAAAAAPAPVRSTSEETGTNVQEAGVDEPDVVKTDGTTLFRIEDGELVTYDLTGSEVERLDSYDLPGPDPGDAELLLAGDTVTVIDQNHAGSGRPGTMVVTYDASDPAYLVQTHTVEYDAGLVTARLHDGVVRVVLTAGRPALDFVQPDRHTTDFEAVEANQQIVSDSTIADWLPTVSYDNGAPEPLLDCEQVAIPDQASGLGTIAVVGFDAPAPDAPSVTGLAVDTDLAYASTDQLYLAANPSVGGFGCRACRGPIPIPIPEPETVPGAGTEGGLIPDWLPTPRFLSSPRTDTGISHLYAFDLDGIDTTFAASGDVDGRIRDRWSMDAVGRVLRVAVGPTSATSQGNSILTFRQQGNDLVEAGRLDDLGVDEGIESVRWFDTLAIVVTFRQVDPLYAVDLTDPAAPELMGELKTPGFSGYLHPLGQHRLLGLGEGPTGDGGWGAQAALFNVTDLTDPQRLDVVSFGPGSTSLAVQDPRQLTWLPDGRTVLSVVADDGLQPGRTGYVSVLSVGEGRLTNRMVEVEHGAEITAVRLVPLVDGRVVLVTGDDASFFDVA